MTAFLKTKLVLTSALFALSACGSVGLSPVVDMTDGFSKDAEIDRLRYFKEIHVKDARQSYGLTGKDVRVTIMGEMVDPNHADIQNRVMSQYNAFSYKGQVKKGNGNRPIGYEYLTLNDGHGTHIAGTIAAECDGIGIEGVACESTLDVYNLGAYDNMERFPSEGWDGENEESRFLSSFATALNDLTRRGLSKITTGSFNLESPVVKLKPGGPLEGKSLDYIMEQIEGNLDGPKDLATTTLVTLENPEDIKFLDRVMDDLGEEDALMAAMGIFLPKSAEWAALENAVSNYQNSGGVYIVTESNNNFGDRSSVLNAMPSLSDKVDPDLWLSVVMVEPDGMDSIKSEADLERVFKTGPYRAPLNTCGREAADYCLVTPSYTVMSTMTNRVAFEGAPRVSVDGRSYQVLDGHSMGAPMVAGALALMQEYNSKQGLGYSTKDMVRILKESANRNFPGYDRTQHGRGMLDVSAAIKAMKP